MREKLITSACFANKSARGRAPYHVAPTITFLFSALCLLARFLLRNCHPPLKQIAFSTETYLLVLMIHDDEELSAVLDRKVTQERGEAVECTVIDLRLRTLTLCLRHQEHYMLTVLFLSRFVSI